MASSQYIIAKINQAREIYGISQAELARRAGMTPNSLGESLRGNRTLTADEIIELSVVLGIGLEAYIEKDRRREVVEKRRRMVEEFGAGIGTMGLDWCES